MASSLVRPAGDSAVKLVMPERRAESAANLPTVRQWANQVFFRASGAPLREGNQITLLKDASENYSAWLHRDWQRATDD